MNVSLMAHQASVVCTLPSPSPGTDAVSRVEGEPASLCPGGYHQTLCWPARLVAQTKFDDYIVSSVEEPLHVVPTSVTCIASRTLPGDSLVYDVQPGEIAWNELSPSAEGRLKIDARTYGRGLRTLAGHWYPDGPWWSRPRGRVSVLRTRRLRVRGGSQQRSRTLLVAEWGDELRVLSAPHPL